MWARRVLLSALLGALVGCSANRADQGSQPVLRVSVATSVADVMRTVADEYERTGGAPVVLNVGGSDTLATQLLAGARADLFVSADDRQMSRVAAGGGILPSTRVDLLSNQLVVVAAHDRVDLVRRIEDLQSSRVRRIAMGDPDAVPAGVYTREHLQAVGLWDAVEAKVVPTRSVRAVLAAVEAGHADVGFAYRTDVAVFERIELSFAIPIEKGPRIRYQVAVTSETADEAVARDFLAFLVGPRARSLFDEAGFLPSR